MNEIIWRQSGEKGGIGNSLNPMILFGTLDNYIGKGEESKRYRLGMINLFPSLGEKTGDKVIEISKGIAGGARSIIHRIPSYKKHIRYKSGKLLDRIIYK